MGAPIFRRTGQIDNPGADFGEAITRLDPLSARAVVEGSLGPSGGPHYVAHGLGRSYRGAIVVGQSLPGVSVRILHPKSATDAERRVTVYQDTAAAQTVLLLVF